MGSTWRQAPRSPRPPPLKSKVSLSLKELTTRLSPSAATRSSRYAKLDARTSVSSSTASSYLRRRSSTPRAQMNERYVSEFCPHAERWNMPDVILSSLEAWVDCLGFYD